MNANPFFRPAFGFSLALALVAGTPPPARAETIFSQDFESDLGSNESTFGNFSINNTLAALNNGTFMMGHAVPYGGLDSAATPLPSYSYYELVLDLRGVVDSELRFDFAGGIEKDFDGFNLVATTGRRNLPPGGLITPTVGSTFQYDSDPLIQHGESSPQLGAIAWSSPADPSVVATAAAVFDLSAFDDSKVIIRFQFGTDSFEGGDGANFDNIFVEGTRLPDTDGDGMHDGYESAHGLNPTVDDRLLDLDGDGIDNITEYAHCTDPDNRDTDGDGLDDNVETNTGTYTSPTDTGTDPRYADTDEDTLRDREEVTVYGTDPNKKDTDGDGFDDNIEIELGYDPTNPASKPPLPIVIGYWSFDDEANPTADLSAAGNDGAVNGGASFVPGQSGEPGDLAISFDGLDDSVTTTASLLNGLTKFTMSGWVRFEATQPNRTGFFGQNDCVEFGMIDATNMQHWLAGSGGALNAPFGPAPEWTHLLITCDATSRTIYVDGEAVASGTGTSAPSSAFTFNIGGGGIYDELATNGNFFNGEIDDVAVWDQVLTVEQIALLASRELTPLGPPNRAQLKIIAIDHDPDADTTELTWESTEGELFEIRKSTTLTGIPVAWPIVLGQVPAAAAPADATTAVVDTNATEPQAFYKIFKIPPPPLFEDDFESDQGWITGANPGDAGTTVWERGVPANVGPFTGANGSANAFGTNLAAEYEAGADIYLRSPVIDLTGPGIANVRLKFQQYFDTDLFSDFGFIRVLRSSDNVPLGATIDLLFETFTVDWESFTTDLPPEAIGEMIRLEFQFTSDATDTNFSGWYIDDVVVTRR